MGQSNQQLPETQTPPLPAPSDSHIASAGVQLATGGYVTITIRGEPSRTPAPTPGWFNRPMPDPTPADPSPSGTSTPDPQSQSELLVKQALMASERTWLAWWRSALVATAGALAVGRVAPQALHVATWPYIILGVGYGILAVGMTLVGARRHRRLTDHTLNAAQSSVGTRSISAFTAGGVALALCTIALVIAQS